MIIQSIQKKRILQGKNLIFCACPIIYNDGRNNMETLGNLGKK